MESGTIAKVVADKGFGFIAPSDPEQRDMFFHASALRGLEFSDKLTGQRVEYRTELFNGRIRAATVWPAT